MTCVRPMMNKPSLAGTLMCGQIAHSLAIVMTTSQCTAALIACFVLSGSTAERDRVSLLPFQEVSCYRSLTSCLFSPCASAIYHSLKTQHICAHHSVGKKRGRLEVPKSCGLNGTDEAGWKLRIVPVARAKQVPAQLYL